MSTVVQANLLRIREEIAEAAKNSGRAFDAVRLLAVSKTFPIQAIVEAFACRQFLFGENRVAELQSKAIILSDSIEWHLIGHVQSNKADVAAHYAQWIHSVDSEKLIRKLDSESEKYMKSLNILLEVNCSGEDQKDGIRGEDAVRHCVEAALRTKHLHLKGFMTMAAFGANDAELHRTFASLREIRDRMSREFGIELPDLSMGMSGDFKQAIAEGATIVRIGTSIFGGRTYA